MTFVLTILIASSSTLLAQPPSQLSDVMGNGEAGKFVAAWHARDLKLVERMALPDAIFFDASGSDANNVKSALRGLSRRMRGFTSKETLIRRQHTHTRGACLLSDVARVQHTSDKRSYATRIRRSMLWVEQKDGAWKLAHLHVSPYTNFASSIATFESQDKKEPSKPGGVVFVGSSSIRMWKTLKQDFPGTNTVHRGFGGSQMIDCIMYVDKLITRHKPRKVVVYEGDNDIGAGKSAQQVFGDFQTLVTLIHSRVPEAKIGFIAIKPSRSRWKLWPEMAKANKMIADLCKSNDRLQYLDTATPMLSKDGQQPAADWFIADGLHMTPKGYAIWTRVIKPWVDEY